MSSIEAAFLGTLSRDAEQRTSKNGKPYLLLNARVGDGDSAQWISILSFDPSAVEIADKFVKGAKIYCEGKLSLNEWTNADSVVRTGLSVMSFHTRLAQIGRQKVKRERSEASVAGGYASPRSAPAGRLPATSTPFDDDIPFAAESR